MALVLGTNCGFVTEAPTADPAGGNWATADAYAYALKHTAPVGAVKIVEIGWWADTATDEVNFEVGIYSHDSGNDEPDAVVGSLSQTNAKGTTAGWKRVTGLNIEITAETIYWIATQCDNTPTTTYANLAHGDAGGLKYKSASTLDSNWGVSNNLNYISSIYAVWEAVATGTNTQINIGDEWVAIDAMQINIGDTWKAVAGAQVNIGDSWKELF